MLLKRDLTVFHWCHKLSNGQLCIVSLLMIHAPLVIFMINRSFSICHIFTLHGDRIDIRQDIYALDRTDRMSFWIISLHFLPQCPESRIKRTSRNIDGTFAGLSGMLQRSQITILENLPQWVTIHKIFKNWYHIP